MVMLAAAVEGEATEEEEECEDAKHFGVLC